MELKHVVPVGCARILVKLESQNPTGSMKDRMARAVVSAALERGDLMPGGTVVEYTGGSTGTSLAFVCAALGVNLSVVTSDAFSLEKRHHMRAMGAQVLEIPSENGRTTKKLIQQMIEKAKELCQEPNTYFSDQFNNPDAAAGYSTLAEELWVQSDHRIDAFVQSVGTAQCIKGVGTRLKRLIQKESSEMPLIVAVEPTESAVLSGGTPGPHKIEGVGPGFVPPMWSESLADELIPISTAEAQVMARRLAREEALFAGTSTGANVLAAIKIAEKLPTESIVTTLACDTGLKYLSTSLFEEIK